MRCFKVSSCLQRISVSPFKRSIFSITAVTAAVVLGSHAAANAVEIKVTIESMSATGGVALSPFSLAAHDGAFDAFNAGESAMNGVENVAELGDGADFLAAATSAQPSAVTGVLTATMGGFGPGIFLPGASGSLTLELDPMNNRYLSYGAMVVPSNDAFVGNDSPLSIELFDSEGNFVAQTVTILGSQIWDAGTETNQLLGSAYLAGQDASLGADENGSVHLMDPATLFAPYLNNEVASGGMFNTLPIAGDPLATISFAVVPEPTSLSILAPAMLGLLAIRRRYRQRIRA